MESSCAVTGDTKSIECMIKYLLGMLRYFFYRNVSFRALVTSDSVISRKARINRHVKVFRSVVGDYSYISRRTSLVCTSVGKFCSIAGSCMIGAGTHTMRNMSTSPIFTERKNATGYSWTQKSTENPYSDKIEIGNDVWIGARVMIVGNVKVGNGAVVAAGAVVTKDVPPYAVVGGIPAKVIKYRFEPQIIESLERLKWWEWSEEVLKKHISCFQNQHVSLELLYELEREAKVER